MSPGGARMPGMRNRGPFADQVLINADGLRLSWREPCAESRYAGSVITWRQVRDAVPGGWPPWLRLRDGRVIFVARGHHEELAAAAAAAGVTAYRPFEYDAWTDLLQPFADTDYELARAACEERLRAHGFTDEEVAAIRRRVSRRMRLLTFATWEWGGYGQSDLLLATLPVPEIRYLRFRQWTDVIASRPGPPAALA